MPVSFRLPHRLLTTCLIAIVWLTGCDNDGGQSSSSGDVSLVDVEQETSSECIDGSTCDSGVCDTATGACQDPTCEDGVHNGDEADVDCGGSCNDACQNGSACTEDSDCAEGTCANDMCQPAACGDGRLNGDEVDVDCGGDCAPCSDGSACSSGLDCRSGVCSDSGVCLPPACEDGVKNGTESHVDCGGDGCELCADGLDCEDAVNCNSGVCINNICQGAACDDNVANGEETDMDCGGGTCSACVGGLTCSESSDCESSICNDDQTCAAFECGDGVINGAEVCDESGDSATCDGDCTLPSCGDGHTNTVFGDECDDGNQDDLDACNNSCIANFCGDSVTNNGEECDDGNQDGLDACNNSCIANFCGDSVTNNGEECDDGNQDGLDACNNSCIANVCGDSIINNGEECDDGNDDDLDACKNNCLNNLCGNGVLDSGEACDLGSYNNDNGFCTRSCQWQCNSAIGRHIRTPDLSYGEVQTFEGVTSCYAIFQPSYSPPLWGFNWKGYAQECYDIGGRLAKIDSQAEDAYVRSLINLISLWTVHIGLTYDNGEWKWFRGRDLSTATAADFVPMTYVPANMPSDDNDLCMRATSSKWDTVGCTGADNFPPVCEFENYGD